MNGNKCSGDSMRDLDHMFDNDDLSSDEAVASVSF